MHVLNGRTDFLVTIIELLCIYKRQYSLGFESMALTVDAAWYGNRERDIR